MRRLIVVLLAIGTTHAMYANHYVKAVAKVEQTGVGGVAVSTSAATPGTYQTAEASVLGECEGGPGHSSVDEDIDLLTFYFFAQTNDENYVWGGWYDGETLVSTDNPYTNNILAESNDEANPTTVLLTAKWVQPRVMGVSDVQLGTITDPTQQTLTGNVVFALADDRSIDNFTATPAMAAGFAFSEAQYATGTYTVPVVYTPSGVNGQHTTTYALASKYGSSAQTATITAVEDYTPAFSMEAFAFGAVSTVEPTQLTKTPTNTNYAAGKATWTAQIEGDDAGVFSVRVDAATGACEVAFAPQTSADYSASLALTAAYTDAAGKTISHEERIALTGSGEIPAETVLAILPSSANPGTYDATGDTPLYTFLDQYGTATKTADFTISFANVQNITYAFSGNDANVFTYKAVEQGASGQVLTILAHVATAVTAETTYTATLTVSAQSTQDGSTVEKALQVRVTLYPKHKNTLAFKLTPWSDKSFYYIFTDDKDIYVLQDINNTDTVNYPITISSTSGDYKDHFSINNDTHTLSGIKEMGNRNLTVEQPESPEYEAAKVVLNTFRLRRHNMAILYPVGSQYLYKNTDYKHIVSTVPEQEGLVTLEVSYNEDGTTTNGAPAMTDGVYLQTLYQNEDGTWGMVTGDRLSGGRTYYDLEKKKDVAQHIQLKVVQPLTDHYYSGTSRPTFYIVKDPIHVPASPGYTVNATTGVISGTWGNNHYQQNGSTFKVEEYKAEWIGYDWDNTAKKWTGKYTGRTDWTYHEDPNKVNNSNAFALYDGGYVVFHFRGVPYYTGLNMYFQSENSDGTIRVEESADGVNWTDVKVASTAANYFSTSGWKAGYMKHTSQYVRYSYSGSNYVVISGSSIQENMHVRTDFTNTLNADTVHVKDLAVRHEINRKADGSWGTFDFTIKAANWGKSGVQWESSNPDFSVTIDDPFENTKGLDTYAERTAHVHYTGSELNASTQITLTMPNFYGSLSSANLRSYAFTVYVVPTGADMPTPITNANKDTKYLTGTMGPIRNTDRTRTGKNTNPYGNLQSTTYSYSQGNISLDLGLREHDFTHCFDDNGHPLFDQLYIFGMTTNTDGTTESYTTYYTEKREDGTLDTLGLAVKNVPKITNSDSKIGSNAVTPLYIYTKKGDQYELTETIENTNVSTQLISIEAAGQKIYFSGHCPALSTGYDQKTHGGAVYVSGGADSRIDLYFEDCVIRSRGHSETGRTAGETAADLNVNGKWPLGSGSTIVFECTANGNADAYFKPTVHFRGDNRFLSTFGCPMFFKFFTQSCAPMQVLVSSTTSYTELTLDDIWLTAADGTQTERTNGWLRLTKSGNTPSVDLGNANTILNFAGGRVELQNSIKGSSMYTNTLAISYRHYANYYGIGPDRNGGTVNFLDGTVSALPLNTVNPNGNHDCTPYFVYTETDAQGNTRTLGLDTITHSDGTVTYYTQTLRTPQNTYIQGGSHNVPIRAVPGTSSDVSQILGVAPKDGADEKAQQVGRLDVKISLDQIDDKGFVVDFVFPDTLGNPTTGETLKEYYTHTGKTYGLESIAPDEDGYIHLWLPLDWLGRVEGVVDFAVKWVEVLTPLTVEVPNQSDGGSPTIEKTVGDDKMLTDEEYENLLYCVLDSRHRDLIDTEGFTLPVLISGMYLQRPLIYVGPELYATIDNATDYRFNKKLYYIFVANADTWTTFTPPFDVKKMYVLESYPEAALETMPRETALKEQTTQNANFAGFVGVGVVMDWYGGNFDGFTREFLTWAYKQDTTSGVYPREANYKTVNGQRVAYYPTNYASAKGYTTDYRGLHALKPVTGPNDWAGNFYLFRSEDNTWAYEDGKFATDWEFVDPDADDGILMRQGQIYSMRFPHCYGCDDPTTRDYWDYWTGKLIIMEGDGPQTIAGTNSHEEQFVPYITPNSASLRGNATFADMQVPNYEGAEGYLSNAYFHRDGQSQFEPANDQATGTLAPGKVFLLANTPATPAGAPARSVASIDVETGTITYEEGDGSESEQTGVPTVSGGRTLLATIEEGALTLIPVVEQDVTLYTSAGQLVFAGHLAAEQTFPLPTGIYLVRGEKEQIKVVIR